MVCGKTGAFDAVFVKQLLHLFRGVISYEFYKGANYNEHNNRG